VKQKMLVTPQEVADIVSIAMAGQKADAIDSDTVFSESVYGMETLIWERLKCQPADPKESKMVQDLIRSKARLMYFLGEGPDMVLVPSKHISDAAFIYDTFIAVLEYLTAGYESLKNQLFLRNTSREGLMVFRQ
jgi:hypothetical protein